MDSFEFQGMTLHFLEGNSFWCDAGRLFGPVPQVVWRNLVEVNQHNQVSQTCDPILIQYQGQNILIDAGYGLDKLDAKTIRHEGVVGENRTLASLAQLGLQAEDIDLILMTHLHNDHCGGLSRRSSRSESGYKLVYPKTRILVNEIEWDELLQPPLRTQATYRQENWQPIVDQVDFWRGYYRVNDAIELFQAKGHSIGHAIIKLSQGGEMVLHLADHLMTHLHLNPLWVPAVDDYPQDTIQSKELWVNYGLQNGAYFSFYHDPSYCLAKFDSESREMTFALERSKPALQPFRKKD
ncbi:MBL fold metallo-hydrolase [Ignavigranum ruoffiae]|uniref:MBL fold metallo-hydrolase n=1 Tax=Ignavigranum ruoffiae TaxID=89093 RepID=UPI002353B8D8|nr:MBL fold metallo-hydrolase [Ignavigranum ruoffiae]